MMKWEVLKYFSRELDENFNIYKYVNKNYKGGETVSIISNPYHIVEFLFELYKIKPEYLNYIQEVILRYSSSEYRGWGPNKSFLYINREFAEKIKINGHFRWIDKGWGDFSASLTYDLSNL